MWPPWPNDAEDLEIFPPFLRFSENAGTRQNGGLWSARFATDLLVPVTLSHRSEAIRLCLLLQQFTHSNLHFVLTSARPYPLSVVVTHLPEEKSRYESRDQAWRLKQMAIREEKFRRNVERSVSAIRRSGDFPSAGRVVEFNPGVRSAGWNKIPQAIQRALESKV